MRDIKAALKFVFPFWKGYWKQEVFLFAMLGVSFVAQLVTPILFKDTVDSIVGFATQSDFFRLLLSLAGLMLLGIVVTWGYAVLSAWVGESLIMDITGKIYSTLLEQRRSFWQKFQAGDVLTRLTQDIISVKSFVVDFSHTLVLQFASLIGMTAVLFYFSTRVGLLILFLLPMIFMLTYWGNGYLQSRASKVRALASSFTQLFQGGINQPFLNFSWLLKPYHMNRYMNTAQEMRREQVTFVNQIQKVNRTISVVTLLVSTVGVLTLVYFDYQLRSMSVGTIIATLMYSGKATQTAAGLANSIVSTKISRVSVLRINEMNEYVSENAQQVPSVGSQKVHLVHPFFNGILKEGIRLPGGDKFTYYLRGENGTGKTTLSYVLAGYDDLAWRISDTWFLIPSDPVLLPGTLLDNIRIIAGRNLSEEDAINALKRNKMDDLMSLFPGGMSTIVSDGDKANISRGQMQAAIIMAAVIKDPPRVVIDEGLNSIDQNTKSQIREPLLEWLSDRKTVIIEHERYLYEPSFTSLSNGNTRREEFDQLQEAV